jgi:DNA-binding response OmpR family regulator
MGKKLLLADDSITIQKVVGIIFANEDYELAIVDNGTSALAKAREARPDIMLVDALMPGMGGYEVCEEVRRDPALSTVPILLMTGAFEPFDEDKARRSGADDFISKPFESQQLIAKVKALLASGSSAAAAPVVAPSAPAPPAPPLQAAAPAVAPVFEAPPAEAAPADELWGAFQEEEEASADSLVMAEAEAAPEDVFAAEVFEAEEVTQAAAPVVAPRPVLDAETASMFRPSFEPVDEQTFSFDEPDTPAVIAKGEDYGFGIDAEPPELAVFADDEPEGFVEEAQEVEAVQATVTAAAPEQVPAPPTPLAPMAPAAFTEDQLRAALASVSRDVIERIVWEVVPDLAESMIADAIKKIREGR